jgi:hypothetical protein
MGSVPFESDPINLLTTVAILDYPGLDIWWAILKQ